MTAPETPSIAVYAGAVLASVTARCPVDCRAHVEIPSGYCDGGCPATPAECWTRLIRVNTHEEED